MSRWLLLWRRVSAFPAVRQRAVRGLSPKAVCKVTRYLRYWSACELRLRFFERGAGETEKDAGEESKEFEGARAGTGRLELGGLGASGASGSVCLASIQFAFPKARVLHVSTLLRQVPVRHSDRRRRGGACLTHSCSTTMSGLFGSAPSAANANPTQGDLSKDVAIANPPEDSVADLAFSPQSEHLAVASWDKKVRIYEIDGNGNSQGTAFFEFEGPVLNCAWSKVSAHILDGRRTDVGMRMKTRTETRRTRSIANPVLSSGWIKSLRCLCRQDSTHAGPWRRPDTARSGRSGRRSRPADPLLRDDRCQWQPDASYGRLGQDDQILGSPLSYPRRTDRS